jgi:membrane carboxypeptidase/penicillin-binding protein
MRIVKRLFILLGKSVLALLSIAGVLLLVAEGWLIWHIEYGIGVPTERQIATLPATGHLCSANPEAPYVPLTEIPPLLQKAVLAGYDLDFYTRSHASPLVQLALASDQHRMQAWSAITSSVSHDCLRVLIPACCSGQPGLDWQIGRIVLMGRVDRALTRDRILESYLNEAYFGRGTYGVVASAKAYFGKTLDALDIDEIAFLVAHIGQPNLKGSRVKKRRDFTIDRMRAAGFIDEAQAVTAKAAPLPWLENQPDDL